MRLNTFMNHYSVCAITITRLVLSSRIKSNNITYGFTRIAIFRDLEPLLGIIVACAPFFPTTLKVMLGRKTKLPSPNALSNGFARTNNQRVRNFGLQTYHKSYSLTKLALNGGGMSETQITSPSIQAKCFLPRKTTDAWQGVDEPTSITVKRGWEVTVNQDCRVPGVTRPARGGPCEFF